MSLILPSIPLAAQADLDAVIAASNANATAIAALAKQLGLDEAKIVALQLQLLPPVLPPYDPRVLWRAGMEAGNMLEWYLDGGGGEFNGNPGNLPGTGLVPSDVAGSRSEASQEQAHSGLWSAKLSIPGAWGAVRLWRWKEAMANPALYYTAWYFVPQVYTVNAGGTTNWWQYKSTDATHNDPFFLIGWQNPTPTTMRMQLVWWGPSTDGPFAGQTGWKGWMAPVDVPIGRWFKFEVRHVSAGDFTGAIQVWQDGVELFHLEGVKTRYPTGNTQWALSNYCSNITPSPCYHFVDDVTISLGRMPA
jgi:hypothetical protein